MDNTIEYYNKNAEQFVQGELQIEEYWITGDVRPGRGEEKWLNLVLLSQKE